MEAWKMLVKVKILVLILDNYKALPSPGKNIARKTFNEYDGDSPRHQNGVEVMSNHLIRGNASIPHHQNIDTNHIHVINQSKQLLFDDTRAVSKSRDTFTSYWNEASSIVNDSTNMRLAFQSFNQQYEMSQNNSINNYTGYDNEPISMKKLSLYDEEDNKAIYNNNRIPQPTPKLNNTALSPNYGSECFIGALTFLIKLLNISKSLDDMGRLNTPYNRFNELNVIWDILKLALPDPKNPSRHSIDPNIIWNILSLTLPDPNNPSKHPIDPNIIWDILSLTLPDPNNPSKHPIDPNIIWNILSLTLPDPNNPSKHPIDPNIIWNILNLTLPDPNNPSKHPIYPKVIWDLFKQSLKYTDLVFSQELEYYFKEIYLRFSNVSTSNQGYVPNYLTDLCVLLSDVLSDHSNLSIIYKNILTLLNDVSNMLIYLPNTYEDLYLIFNNTLTSLKDYLPAYYNYIAILLYHISKGSFYIENIYNDICTLIRHVSNNGISLPVDFKDLLFLINTTVNIATQKSHQNNKNHYIFLKEIMEFLILLNQTSFSSKILPNYFVEIESHLKNSSIHYWYSQQYLRDIIILLADISKDRFNFPIIYLDIITLLKHLTTMNLNLPNDYKEIYNILNNTNIREQQDIPIYFKDTLNLVKDISSNQFSLSIIYKDLMVLINHTTNNKIYIPSNFIDLLLFLDGISSLNTQGSSPNSHRYQHLINEMIEFVLLLNQTLDDPKALSNFLDHTYILLNRSIENPDVARNNLRNIIVLLKDISTDHTKMPAIYKDLVVLLNGTSNILLDLPNNYEEMFVTLKRTQTSDLKTYFKDIVILFRDILNNQFKLSTIYKDIHDLMNHTSSNLITLPSYFEDLLMFIDAKSTRPTGGQSPILKYQKEFEYFLTQMSDKYLNQAEDKRNFPFSSTLDSNDDVRQPSYYKELSFFLNKIPPTVDQDVSQNYQGNLDHYMYRELTKP